MIKSIDKYKAVVSYHGRILTNKITTYYKSAKRVLHMREALSQDSKVDIVGTGVCGFDTNIFTFDISDILFKNMADIWVSTFAKRQGINRYVLSHKSDYIVINTLMKEENIETIYDSHKITINCRRV